MSDLGAARAKIERAKEHIRDLNEAATSYLALNPYKVVPEFYVEHEATAYFLDEFQPVPARVSLLAGDSIHSLRTALDYLAYSLIPKAQGEVLKHVYFPICKGLKEYMAESTRRTKGMPQAAKDRIDALKPYCGGNDTLWELHELDIIDKHRLLVATGITVAELGFEIEARFVEATFKGLFRLPPGAIPNQTINFPAPKPLFTMEKGALLYWVKGNFKTDEHINFTFDIAFGESEICGGKLIRQTLTKFVNTVESILLEFENL